MYVCMQMTRLGLSNSNNYIDNKNSGIHDYGIHGYEYYDDT